MKYTTLFFLMVLLFLSSSCRCVAQDQLTIAQIIDVQSKVLNEVRKIYVSTPKNYGRNIQDYPIVIVMDAEYLFEIANSIIKVKASRNLMPETIVVGVPNNTGKRYEMALPLIKEDGSKFFGEQGGHAKKYLDFFRQELLPFLKSNYRSNNHISIIGMSPSFGPVLEAFWNEPDLFSGYIILAAELSVTTLSGETIANKLLESIQDERHPAAAIYVGKADKDLARRPPEEARAFSTIAHELASTANKRIRYNFEILQDEDHYSMAITGIQHGLDTIYPKDRWNVPYRKFWASEKPAVALKAFYDDLSAQYGFKILPLEDSFYSSQTLMGSARRLARQGRVKEQRDLVNLAVQYYPNSAELKKLQMGSD